MSICSMGGQQMFIYSKQKWFKIISKIEQIMSHPVKNATFRSTQEEMAACLDQKNTIISLLQSELTELRTTQQQYDRSKEHLLRARANYEALQRETDIVKGTNQDRLDVTSKIIFELRVQTEHLENDLRTKSQLLLDAKFGCQQLMQQENQKEDEAADIEIKLQEQKSALQFKRMEQDRLKVQIAQLKQEVERQKRQNSAINHQSETISDKMHKTQSYIRNLLREEANLNDNLTRIEDQNNFLDSTLTQVEENINTNHLTINTFEKQNQESHFVIASRELQKKRVDSEIKEKTRILLNQKDRFKNIMEQLEARKSDGFRLQNQLKEGSEEVNFITAKNNQIKDVNEQLKNDLTVCQKHLQNVLRINKNIENEIVNWEEVNMSTIKKLQSVIKQPNNQGKWSCSSWRTAAEAIEK